MTEVADIDVFSGKEEVNRLCENDFDRQPRSWLESLVVDTIIYLVDVVVKMLEIDCSDGYSC
jgi:hypothetical protein